MLAWGALAGYGGFGLGLLCERIGYRPGRAIRFVALLATGPVGWLITLWLFVDGD
jgi:hypothetical protein